MSAAALAIEEPVEPDYESLTERMGRSPLPVAEALRHATQIATCLRDLHMQHLIFGAVSSQLIQLGPKGASLRSSGALAQRGDASRDVKGLGAVLGEMLPRLEGPPELVAEMAALAVRCQEEKPDMQQVSIALRLLGMRARHGAVAVCWPPPVRRAHEAPKKRPVRLRLHLALHWKPLVNLAAFALSGK